MPNLALEMEAGGLVAGIDEAGRGPLAGPVVAAAAIIDASLLAPSLAAAIDDSKRLSPRRRRELFAVLPTFAQVGLGAASVTEIDRLNILGATMLAMRRAILALSVVPDLALIDGNRAPDLPCPARTLVGGDGICLSIAAASIAAKVVRDRIMTALAQRHPGFGWERNAGYPTLEHRAALVRLGATPHHRRSFAPVARVLQ